MAFILCSFASPRSRPEKIEEWISHLEALRAQHVAYPDRVQTIDRLLSRARQWRSAGSANGARTSRPARIRALAN
jgi:hypothetical protein